MNDLYHVWKKVEPTSPDNPIRSDFTIDDIQFVMQQMDRNKRFAAKWQEPVERVFPVHGKYYATIESLLMAGV